MSSRSSSPCKRPPQNRNAPVSSEIPSHESNSAGSTPVELSSLDTDCILPKSNLIKRKKRRKKPCNLGNGANIMIKKLLMKNKRRERELIRIKLNDNRIPRVALVRLHLASLKSKLRNSHTRLESEKKRDLIQSIPKLVNKKDTHNPQANLETERNGAEKSHPKSEIEEAGSNQPKPKLCESNGGGKFKSKPENEKEINRPQTKLDDTRYALDSSQLKVKAKKDSQSQLKVVIENQELQRSKLRQRDEQNNVCLPQPDLEHREEDHQIQSKIDDENEYPRRHKSGQQDRQNDLCLLRTKPEQAKSDRHSQLKVDKNQDVQQSKFRPIKQKDDSLGEPKLEHKKKDDQPQSKADDKFEIKERNNEFQCKIDDKIMRKRKDNRSQSKAEDELARKKSEDQSRLKIVNEHKNKNKDDESHAEAKKTSEIFQQTLSELEDTKVTHSKPNLKTKKMESNCPQPKAHDKNSSSSTQLNDECKKRPDNSRAKPTDDQSPSKLLDRRKDHQSCLKSVKSGENRRQLQTDEKVDNFLPQSKSEEDKKIPSQPQAAVKARNVSVYRVCDVDRSLKLPQFHELNVSSKLDPKILMCTPVVRLEKSQISDLVIEKHLLQDRSPASAKLMVNVDRPPTVAPEKCGIDDCAKKLIDKLENSSMNPIKCTKKSSVSNSGRKSPRILINKSINLKLTENSLVNNSNPVPKSIGGPCVGEGRSESSASPVSTCTNIEQDSYTENNDKVALVGNNPSLNKVPIEKTIGKAPKIPEKIGTKCFKNNLEESSGKDLSDSCYTKSDQQSTEISGSFKEKRAIPSKKETKLKPIQSSKEKIEKLPDVPAEENLRPRRKIAHENPTKSQRENDLKLDKKSVVERSCVNLNPDDPAVEKISGESNEILDGVTECKSVNQIQDIPTKKLGRKVKDGLTNKTGDLTSEKKYASKRLKLPSKLDISGEKKVISNGISGDEKNSEILGNGNAKSSLPPSKESKTRKLPSKLEISGEKTVILNQNSGDEKQTEILENCEEKSSLPPSKESKAKKLPNKIEIFGENSVISNHNPGDEKQTEVLGNCKEKSSLPPKKESKTKKLECLMRASQEILNNVVDEFLRPRKNLINNKNTEASGNSSEQRLSEKPLEKVDELPNKLTENQKDRRKSLSSSCKILDESSRKINNFSETEAANATLDEPVYSIQKSTSKVVREKTKTPSHKVDNVSELETANNSTDESVDTTQKKTSKGVTKKTEELLDIESDVVLQAGCTVTDDQGKEKPPIQSENSQINPVEMNTSKPSKNRLEISGESKEKSTLDRKKTNRKPVNIAPTNKMKLLKNLPEKNMRPKRNLANVSNQELTDSSKKNLPEMLRDSNSELEKLKNGCQVSYVSVISDSDTDQHPPVGVEKLAENKGIDIEIGEFDEQSHKKSTSKLRKGKNVCTIDETCTTEVSTNDADSTNEGETTHISYLGKVDENSVVTDETNNSRRFSRKSYIRSVKNSKAVQEKNLIELQRSEMKKNIHSENANKNVENSDHSTGKDVEKSSKSTEKCVTAKSVVGEKRTDFSKILDDKLVNVSDESTQTSVTDCNNLFSDDLNLRKRRPRQPLLDEIIKQSTKTPKVAPTNESHVFNEPRNPDHKEVTKTSEIGNTNKQRPKRRVIRKSSDCFCTDHSSDNASGKTDDVEKSGKALVMDTTLSEECSSFPVKIGKRLRRSSARGNYAESLNQVETSLEENSADPGISIADTNELRQGYAKRGRKKSVSSGNSKNLRRSISEASLCPLPVDSEDLPRRVMTRGHKLHAKSTTDLTIQDDPPTTIHCGEVSTRNARHRTNYQVGRRRSQSTSRICKTSDIGEFARSTPDLSNKTSNEEELEVTEKSKKTVKSKPKIRTVEIKKMTRNSSKTDSCINSQENEMIAASDSSMNIMTSKTASSTNEIAACDPLTQMPEKSPIDGSEVMSADLQASAIISPEKSEIPSRRASRKRSKSESRITVTKPSLRNMAKNEKSSEMSLNNVDDDPKTDENLPSVEHNKLRRVKSKLELQVVTRTSSFSKHGEQIDSERTVTRESRKVGRPKEQTVSPAKINARRSRSTTRNSDKISSYPKYKSRSVSRLQNKADNQAGSIPKEAKSRRKSNAIVPEIPMVQNISRMVTRNRDKSCSERKNPTDDLSGVPIHTDHSQRETSPESNRSHLKRTPRKSSLGRSKERDASKDSNKFFSNREILPKKIVEPPSKTKKAKLDINPDEIKTIGATAESCLNSLLKHNAELAITKNVHQSESDHGAASSEVSIHEGILKAPDVVVKKPRGRPKKIVKLPSKLKKLNSHLDPSGNATLDAAAESCTGKQSDQQIITSDAHLSEKELVEASPQDALHERDSSASSRTSLRLQRRSLGRRDKTFKKLASDGDRGEKSAEEDEIRTSDCLTSFLAFYHGETNENIRLSTSDDSGSPEKILPDSGLTDKETVDTDICSETNNIGSLDLADELSDIPKQDSQKTPKKNKKQNTVIDNEDVSKLAKDIPVRCSRRIAQRAAQKKKVDESPDSVEETPMHTENLTPSAEDVEVQQSLASPLYVEMEKASGIVGTPTDEIFESIEPICVVPSDTPVEMMDHPMEDPVEPPPSNNDMEQQRENVPSILDEILKNYAEENSAETSSSQNMVEACSQEQEMRDPLCSLPNETLPNEGIAQESTGELVDSVQLPPLTSNAIVFGNFLIESTGQSPIATPEHVPVHLNPHSLPAEVDVTSEIIPCALSEEPRPADLSTRIETSVSVDPWSVAEDAAVHTGHPVEADEILPSTVIEASTEPHIPSVRDPLVESDPESTEENRLATAAGDGVARRVPDDETNAVDSYHSATGDDAEPSAASDTSVESQNSPWQSSEDALTGRKECSENVDNAVVPQTEESTLATTHVQSTHPENSSEADKSSSYDSCVENASEENYHDSLSEDVDSDENLADKVNRINKLQVTPLNSFDSPDSGVQDTMEDQPRPLASKYQRSSFKEKSAKVGCKYCDETFASNRELTKHVRNQHRIVMKITKTDTNKHVTQLVERSSKLKPSRQLEDEAYVEEEEDDEEAEEEEEEEDVEDEEEEEEVLTSIEEASGQIKDGEIKMIVAKESGTKNSHVVKEIKITAKTKDGNRSARSLSFSPIRSEITIKRRSNRARKYPIFTESELIAKQLAAASSATSCAPSFPATPAVFNAEAILNKPLDKDDLFPAPEPMLVQPDIVLDEQLNVTLRKIPAPEQTQPTLEGLAQRIIEAAESDSSQSPGGRSRRPSTRSSLCEEEQLQQEPVSIVKCSRRLSMRSSVCEDEQLQLEQTTTPSSLRLRRSSRRGSVCENELPTQQQQAAVADKPTRRVSTRSSICEDEQTQQELVKEALAVDERPKRLSTRIALGENEQLLLDQETAIIDEYLKRMSTRTSVCEDEQAQPDEETAKIHQRPRRMSTRSSICEDERSEQHQEAEVENRPRRMSTRTSICEDDHPQQTNGYSMQPSTTASVCEDDQSQLVGQQSDTVEDCPSSISTRVPVCEDEQPQQQEIAESSELPETTVREEKRRRESETDSTPLGGETRPIEEQAVVHEDKRPRLDVDQHLEQNLEHEPVQGPVEESGESPNLLAKYNITRELVVPLTRVSESLDTGEELSSSNQASFSEVETTTTTTTTSQDSSFEGDNNAPNQRLDENDVVEIPQQRPPVSERREVATTTEHVVRTKVTTSVQTVDPQVQMQQPLLTLHPPQLPEAMSSIVLAAAANAGIDGTAPNILLNSMDPQRLAPMPHTMLQQHQFYVVYIPDNAAEGPSATLLNFQPVPDEMMNKSGVSFSLTPGNANPPSVVANPPSVVANPPNVVAPNVVSPAKIVTTNAATGTSSSANTGDELNRSFVCSSCAEVSDLVGRLEANHGMTEEDKSNIECPYCSNHFQSLVYLEYHVRQEHVKCQNEAQCRHSGLNSLRIPSHEAASEFEMYIAFALKCRSCYDIFPTVSLLNDHVMRKHSNLVRRSPSAMAAAAAAGITSPFLYPPLQNGARSVLQCPSDCVCRVGIRGNLSPLQRQQMIRRCPNAMRRLEKVEAAAYEVYTCNLCKSTFLMKDEVVEHLMKMHDVPCKFPCYKCLVSFRSPQLQERHRCSETTLRELDKLFYIAILPSNVSGKDETSPTATATATLTNPTAPTKQISTPIVQTKPVEQTPKYPATRYNGKRRHSCEIDDDELSLLSKKFKYHEKPNPNKPDGRRARQRNCGKLKCSKRFYYLKSLQDHYVQEHIVAKIGHSEPLKKKAAELLKLLRTGKEKDPKVAEIVNLLVRWEDPEDQLLFSNLMLNGQELDADQETLEAIRSIEEIREPEPQPDPNYIPPCVKCKLRVNLSNKSGNISSFADISSSHVCQCRDSLGLRATRSSNVVVPAFSYLLPGLQQLQQQQQLQQRIQPQLKVSQQQQQQPPPPPPQAQPIQSPPTPTQQPPSTPQKSPAQANATSASPTSSIPPTFQPRPRRARLMEPYACNRCPKSFRKGRELTAHRLEVHKIGHCATRPFVCELCHTKFFTPERLKKHRAYKHDGVVFDAPIKSLLDNVSQPEPVATHGSANVSGQSIVEVELSEQDDEEEEDDDDYEENEETSAELDASSGLAATASAAATLDDSSKDAGDSLNATVTSTDGDNASSTCARRDSSDSSSGPKEPESQSLCSLCAEVCSSKVSLKNHLKREHGCRASICQFCNSLLIETSEVRHMLDHHIVRSKGDAAGAGGLASSGPNSIVSPEACDSRREVDELVRTLGLHRLQSLMIYHDFEGKCNNAIMRCPICPEMFATRESCRFHYVWIHDDTCVLCDEVFRSGSCACQHKVSAHTSTASYLWCMQRLVTAIVDSLRLNPNQPSPLLYQELLARLGQDDQPPMLLVGRGAGVAGGGVGVDSSSIIMGSESAAKSSAAEQTVGAGAQPTFLEEVVLSEDQLPDSGNIIEVVIGKDDSEDDLISMLNLSPSYPSREQTSYDGLSKAGVAPPEEDDDEEASSGSGPCASGDAVASSAVAEGVPVASSSPIPTGAVSPASPSPGEDATLPPVPTTPTHQGVVQVMPASTPPSATGTMGGATLSPGESYVCSGVCKYKLDNGEEQLVLVVTDDDLVTYRNDIGSLATRISATCDSLTLDEITEMLKAYFEGVGMGATANPQ